MVCDGYARFPVYELLTLLTATVHQSQGLYPDLVLDPTPTSTSGSTPTPAAPPPQPPYHALLTSHHLISPTKRHSIHGPSSSPASQKVGYPGIVYAKGPWDAVETFIRNVKGMHWLALRARVLILWVRLGITMCVVSSGEVSKIGQVLERTRMRGREVLVTNPGIGAPSKESQH